MLFNQVHLASLLLGFTVYASAHMLLYKPQPFASGDMPDNGPLNGDGTSNYPCKSIGGKDSEGGPAYAFSFPRTELPMGSVYTIQFQGESVHGGGSCQFSLTKDLEPTPQSEFKVIHSIEGGCPARNTSGNLGADDSSTTIDPFTYPITIPTDLEAGQYTFAWTWFNKVGNREMYMGCAPVTVTGTGSKSSTSFDSYPDLFLANIPDVPCVTREDETKELQFPVPGKTLQIEVSDETGDGLVPPGIRPHSNGHISQCYAPVGQAHTGVYTLTAASGAAGKTPAAGSTLAAGSTPAASMPQSQASSAYSTPVASEPAPSTPAASNPTSAPATPSPIPAGGGGSSGSGTPPSGSCASGSVSCGTSGSIICIGASHWGLCNNGCAVTMELAAGTTCSNGSIVKRRLPPQARRRNKLDVTYDQ